MSKIVPHVFLLQNMLQVGGLLCPVPGVGVLNFHFGMSVWPKGPKIGAYRMDCHQILGLGELIFFVKFEALGTEI